MEFEQKMAWNGSELEFNGWVVDRDVVVSGGRNNYGNAVLYAGENVILAKKREKGFWFNGGVVRKGQELNMPGKYVLPGGADDQDMSISALIKKELKDETGIDLDTIQKLDVMVAQFKVKRGRSVLYVAYVNLYEKSVLDNCLKTAEDNLSKNNQCRVNLHKAPKKVLSCSEMGTVDDELDSCFIMDLKNLPSFSGQLCSWHYEVLTHLEYVMKCIENEGA